MDKEKIKRGVTLLLEGIGEDTSREGLIDTPDRIARMYEEIFAGLGQTADGPLSRVFTAQDTDMIIEKDITFYSMCEHHLLPFYGKAHIAYIPRDKVAGLSKLARTVEVFARRPQLQERMTVQIAEAIMNGLNARGSMVILEAEHMCMTMRGIKKPGSSTVTISSKGVFADEPELRQTFINLAGVRQC